MSGPVQYTPFHPKWYRRPVSVWWWLESWRYTRFVLRELTSVPVGFFSLVTIWQIAALGQGPEAYAGFQDWMKTPLFITLHILSIFAVFFHALTWFHLAPTALTVRLGEKKVPDSAIVALNYVAWIVISGLVGWIWLGR